MIQLASLKKKQTIANSHKLQVRMFIYLMRNYFCWKICVCFPVSLHQIKYQNGFEVANQENRIKSIERRLGKGKVRLEKHNTSEELVTFTCARHCHICQRGVVTQVPEFTNCPNEERKQSISQFNIFIRLKECSCLGQSYIFLREKRLLSVPIMGTL